MDTGTEVQKKAYILLQQAAYKRTQHLVVEAAVDAENTFKAELPPELLSILQQTINFDDAESLEHPNVRFNYMIMPSIDDGRNFRTYLGTCLAG